MGQGGGDHGARRCPLSSAKAGAAPWACRKEKTPALNGCLQIKEPQLPFFPVMAPEANVLKRKQKDCFTSHKWGRREVGKEALECCIPARAPAAGWRLGGGVQLALTWALLCGLLVLNPLLTPSLLL